MPRGVYDRSGRRTPLADRFWTKVDKDGPGGCWLWTGATSTVGYGKVLGAEGRLVTAHRVAYEFLVGPIPEGCELDHLCRNRACVNPAHLEPVTGYENIMRGESVSAKNKRKTHCKRGHPLSGVNLYLRPCRGRLARQCKACGNLLRRHRREAVAA